MDAATFRRWALGISAGILSSPLPRLGRSLTQGLADARAIPAHELRPGHPLPSLRGHFEQDDRSIEGPHVEALPRAPDDGFNHAARGNVVYVGAAFRRLRHRGSQDLQRPAPERGPGAGFERPGPDPPD